MAVKIVVADDHPIVCEGIRRNAESAGMKFIASIVSPEKISELLRKHKPDVLVTEIRLSGQDALRTIEQIKQSELPCPIVVFSANANPTHIGRASALGCHDYVLKTSPIIHLIDAIKSAATGAPTPEKSLLKTTRTRLRRPASHDAPHPLTNRETQVLRHVALGLSNREIGKSLSISVETVKEHVQNILRKLDVNDRTQAAIWAIRKELD